jgi:hypothetical protein
MASSKIESFSGFLPWFVFIVPKYDVRALLEERRRRCEETKLHTLSMEE